MFHIYLLVKRVDSGYKVPSRNLNVEKMGLQVLTISIGYLAVAEKHVQYYIPFSGGYSINVEKIDVKFSR